MPQGSPLSDIPPPPQHFSPDQQARYYAAMGVDPQLLGDMAPTPAEDGSYQMPSTGVAGDLFAGAGNAILKRALGRSWGVEAPDTLAAGIGAALPVMPAAAALPAAGIPGMLAQGALAAGWEALDPGSTPQSAATAGVFGAAATGVTDLASRVLTGAGRAARAWWRGMPARITSQRLQTIGNAAGGNVVVDQINRNAMTLAASRSIGQNTTRLGPQQLAQAADDIGQQFDALLPDTATFDLSAVEQALQGVQQGGIGVRANRVLQSITNWASVPGPQVRALRAALAERARQQLGEAPALADDLLASTDLIDDAAERVIGPTFRAQFRQARELWKNLRIIESLPTVRKSGEVSAGELSRKLAQEGAGYGTSFLRDTRNVLPGTQGMFDVARGLAEDAAARVGNPGTAPALAGTAGLGVLAGVLTGATPPGVALAGLGAAGASQAAGLGAVGTSLPWLNAAAGQVAGEAAPEP